MRVLVVGSGGREHALAWKLSHNPTLDRLYAAPGNPGIAELAQLVPIQPTEVGAIADFAEAENIDLTVVGPERPLVLGLADELASRGLRVFGPSSKAALIESSKAFCRDFANRHGIPMAAGESFDDSEAAIDYARSLPAPVVVKADGPAEGKGVMICADHERAAATIDAMINGRMFGESSSRVVVEECLQGREASLLCLTDGEALVCLEAAQDYKRALDGDEGLNTGGMGSYSPVAWLTEDMREQAVSEVVVPVVAGLAEEGRRYVGCLYAGLMFTPKGPRLIEVNCRFGDPEAQALLPRISSDLCEVMLACVEGNVRNYSINWRREASVCVAIASGGYPGDYKKGVPISGLEDAASLRDVIVFHANTELRGKRLVSAGGRVLNVVACGRTVKAARKRAYEAVNAIRMDGMHYRTDIAADA
jgi:phosphoribosylamine--glycine ligase